MVVFQTKVKDPDSHLLFPVIRNRRVNFSVGEIVGVRMIEGRCIVGIVDEVCSDKEHFWLRSSLDLFSKRERFSLKIDQIIKLN